MNAKVMIGAVVGGVIGAIIWAVITTTTGYEVGWVAWGIGILVGGLARAAGGSGQATGVMCALLALASIFVGKMVAARTAMNNFIEEAAAEGLTEELYEEFMLDSDDFAKLQSEDEYPQFMVDHSYTDASEPGDVTPEELDNFIREHVPDLRTLHQEQPDYMTWRQQEKQSVTRAMQQISLVEFVVDDLGLLDIVFAVLGLATAYRVGGGED